ncbi:hypothetical protein SLEP1_g35508 [Rubroshorea leprosula]|uniref:Uncharacterized protein n=1 Tax=Rubroshorea leprosula TaxID=152421 RepID=A0AAV5KNN5_9ROSI|nr:hypothetical protein SLEP1_g35508 [Rubroshorea leprosula]
MQEANFYMEGSVMSLEQIQEAVQRRVSLLFKPRWSLHDQLLTRLND